MQEHTKKVVMYPKPVSGLRTTSQTKTWYHDPSIVLTSDFVDHKGTPFARKGQRINPLHQVPWGTPLILFDGTNKDQLAFVKKTYPNAKWVLVNGSPIELGALEKRPVFFDQAGKITTHFHIQTIPTVIVQDGNTLKLTTFKLSTSKAGD